MRKNSRTHNPKKASRSARPTHNRRPIPPSTPTMISLSFMTGAIVAQPPVKLRGLFPAGACISARETRVPWVQTMGRTMFLRQTAAACILGLITCAACAQPPHIVYILADDLGWKDVGYHGGGARTPNLDRLAREGARLEKFYTLPYSTPTRAALMTGPLSDALRTADAVDPAVEPVRTAARRTNPRTDAEGRRLPHGHARQVAARALQARSSGRRGAVSTSFYGSFNGEIDYFRRDQPGRRTGLASQRAASRGKRILHDAGRPAMLRG